jgi:hypothetical protein
MGLPTTIADVGGDHVMALAQVANGFRTPLQQTFVTQLLEREGNKGARLLAALGRGTRLGLENAYELSDRLAAQAKVAAAPHYEQAFAQTVEVPSTLRRLLGTAEFREAYNAGRATAVWEDAANLNRGLPVPELPTNADELRSLPVRAFDYMKRELDQIIAGRGREGRPPLSRQSATAIRAALNEVTQDITKQVPDYGLALKVWGGFQRHVDALEAGREGFLKKPAAIIRDELAASASPDMYRIGAIQALADAVHGIGGEGGDAVSKLFGSRLYGAQDRSMSERIGTLFRDPHAAQDFTDRVAGETSSSRAAKRLARGGPNEEAATLRLQGPLGATARFAQRLGLKQPNASRARAVANEVTNLFTVGLERPDELPVLLHSLQGFGVRGDAILGGLRLAVAQQAAGAVQQ